LFGKETDKGVGIGELPRPTGKKQLVEGSKEDIPTKNGQNDYGSDESERKYTATKEGHAKRYAICAPEVNSRYEDKNADDGGREKGCVSDDFDITHMV